MKQRFPKILVGLVVAALTGLGITGYAAARDLTALAQPMGRTLSDSTTPATFQPQPTPTATPTPQPTISLAPVATPLAPAPSIAPHTIIATSVAPAARPGVPLICQSQTYSPERERQCPHAAPIKQATLADLDLAPTVTPAPTPVPATPTPTAAAPTPVPATAAPAPTTATTPTPAPSLAPTATPSPNCGGNYPARLCYAAQDSIVDPWGMYNRECTSYAAFRVSASGRKMPYWGGKGNAVQWPANARAAGIPVDSTPQIGDVAIFSGSSWGHAMYVENVLADGKIYVSQFNYGATPGTYSTMIVPAAGLTFIHFQ